MKYNSLLKLILFCFVCAFIATSCVKEGPMGPAGADGEDGADGAAGKDANETCIICHTPDVVDRITVEFQYSKHEEGEAAIEEAGNTGCTPCHAQEAFKYVVENNVTAAFEIGANGKYANKYMSTPGTAYGRLLCGTCHSSIHKTYASSDMPALTTVAAVPMTMWGGSKTINLTADGGMSNLCVKCHQPRPRQKPTQTTDGNVVDYAALAANPNGMAFDATNPNAATNIDRPSYRMHIHYGAVGAIYAGVGGVEFVGSMPYTNSGHPSVASCKDCHMGTMYGTSNDGASGGHTFKAKGNLTTCNAAGCHTNPVTPTSGIWANTRNDIKGLLEQLATKLTVNGVEILNQSDDQEANLWYALTTKHYDGYLNVYDPGLNPGGGANETGPFKNEFPAGSWTQAQKDFNNSLPKLSLNNAQYGALINFQLCLREYSLGIHNYAYTKALLTNSIAKL